MPASISSFRFASERRCVRRTLPPQLIPLNHQTVTQPLNPAMATRAVATRKANARDKRKALLMRSPSNNLQRTRQLRSAPAKCPRRNPPWANC